MSQPQVRDWILRTVIRTVPLWRSSALAAYRDILEPYAPKWDYYDAGVRPRVALWDISSGCILWLPPKSQVRPEALEGSGLEYETPDAFDHPVLCVDVEIKGPTSGLVYFVKMGSFSETGGPTGYFDKVNNRFVSQWIGRPWADTVLPIVRTKSSHNYKRALYLENDQDRTENSRLVEDATVKAGYGIFAISFDELRCHTICQGQENLFRSGKWLDGWRYRLDEPSFRIVSETIGLRQRPWLMSGPSMWDHFIEHTGIGTEEQLEKLKKAQHASRMLRALREQKLYALHGRLGSMESKLEPLIEP